MLTVLPDIGQTPLASSELYVTFESPQLSWPPVPIPHIVKTCLMLISLPCIPESSWFRGLLCSQHKPPPIFCLFLIRWFTLKHLALKKQGKKEGEREGRREGRGTTKTKIHLSLSDPLSLCFPLEIFISYPSRCIFLTLVQDRKYCVIA